jgi:hypothetical protein
MNGDGRKLDLVGREGIEPSTNRLKAGCSTAELTARDDDGWAGNPAGRE